MTTPISLSGLRRLHEAGTPGPLTHDADENPDDVSIWAGDHLLANIGDWSEQTIQELLDDAAKSNPYWASEPFYISPDGLKGFAGKRRNAVQVDDAALARLIVATVNALPALLAIAEAARESEEAEKGVSAIKDFTATTTADSDALQRAADAYEALRAALALVEE